MCRLGLDCDNCDVTWLTRYIYFICLMTASCRFLSGALRLQKTLDEEIAHYRQLSFAITTKKSYASELKSYLSFCNDVNRCPVPVTQTNLLRYAAFLARRLAPRSIPAYLNIIRVLHLEANIPNPLCANFVLDTLLKGINHDTTIYAKQTVRIIPDLLLKIRSLIDLSAPY